MRLGRDVRLCGSSAALSSSIGIARHVELACTVAKLHGAGDFRHAGDVMNALVMFEEDGKDNAVLATAAYGSRVTPSLSLMLRVAASTFG